LIFKLKSLYGISGDEEKLKKIALHLYDQARLSHGSLDSESLKRYLKVSSELLTESSEQIL